MTKEVTCVTLIPCCTEKQMANLTITIDDEVLKKARIKALEQGTSVNAILREYLESYSAVHQTQQEACDDLVRLSQDAKSGSKGKTWNRDELHER